MMLPVYDQYKNVWYVENEDGVKSTITNEEYERRRKELKIGKIGFKTRYDKD